MSRVTLPADSDILCESCGYTLNGLPESGNCPECGQPIAQSRSGDGRSLSEYEIDSNSKTFRSTSRAILAHPRDFFRRLSVRSNTPEAAAFARRWRVIAAVLFSLALFGHVLWMSQIGIFPYPGIVLGITAALAVPVILLLMRGVTWLASLLTALEARYWGIRLPLPAVTRALQFHTPHYLPVGIVAVVIVWGYQILLFFDIIGYETGAWYVYTLCGAVVLSAWYLFRTYWIAMRSIMYANR
jgi:hypothetical protein